MRITTTAGTPIRIRCYACGTRTLRFDETGNVFRCTRCARTLTAHEAINEIPVTDPHEPHRSNWQAIMSSIWQLPGRKRE